MIYDHKRQKNHRVYQTTILHRLTTGFLLMAFQTCCQYITYTSGHEGVRADGGLLSNEKLKVAM